MKRFILLILFALTLPLLASADVDRKDGVDLSGMSYADGQALPVGACTIADCSGATTCTGSTGCVKRETFDGATLCYSGFTSNCDNAWSYAANSVDFDNATSPSPLQGTYSLAISSGSNNKVFLEWTGASTQYVGMMVNCAAFPCTFYLEDAIDGTQNCILQLANTTTMYVVSNGGTGQNTTTTLATGTTYYVKIKSVTGSGTNASCTPYVSTDGTTWTTGTASTNGTWTSNSDTLYLYDQNTSFDDIRISATDFDY